MTVHPERATRPVRIANCSGFFGDRLSAAREMVEGGPIDVLTGDWLAELTMLILHKGRLRNPNAGYATTFLTQMEQVLATCVERGIRVVTNAGGLNPAGCAQAVRDLAHRVGVDVAVAHIEGDDLMDRVDELRPGLTHLDTGAALTGEVVTANAYLGGFGIAAALRAGAQVVVCPRVTDAALVVGPAAWWWDWTPHDLDALAGAVVAGHVIECGAQATGGNYAFFTDLPDLTRSPGFPLTEVDRDGSSVITKHPGTGGAVTVGTVTAQVLYEIGDIRYPNPDVVARFDTIRLDQVGPDRVRLSGIRGEPAPPTTKVSINLEGGFRNRMTFVLTGLNQAAKADWVTQALFDRLGGRERFDEVDVRFVPAPPDAPTQEQASGRLHVQVKSSNEALVGRAFSSACVELGLSNYPGFFATSPPGGAQSYGVFWPALVPHDVVHHLVVLPDGQRLEVPSPDSSATVPAILTPTSPAVAPVGPRRGDTLGLWFGARSGDKGPNANVGVWALDDAGYAWLVEHLTSVRLAELMPETAGLVMTRAEFPLIRAVNFVIHGLLGEGVASSTAFDTQAKGLGEYLRSRRWPT
jgi:hypothetical protein